MESIGEHVLRLSIRSMRPTSSLRDQELTIKLSDIRHDTFDDYLMGAMMIGLVGLDDAVISILVFIQRGGYVLLVKLFSSVALRMLGLYLEITVKYNVYCRSRY